MAEYIEREALIKQFCERCNEEMSEIPCEPSECFAREVIIGVPAVGIAPVRHGRWVNERSRIKLNFAEYCYDCSECGQPTGYDRYPISSFCPHCGAKMDGEE